MIDKQMFINLYHSIITNDSSSNRKTNTDTEGDCTKDAGNRALEDKRTNEGHRRCACKQEAHKGRTCSRMSCIRARFRQVRETVKHSEGSQDSRRQGRISCLTLPPFLFSFQSIQILQSIDDICAQINPILWSMIFK